MDSLDRDARSERMSRIRGKDSHPEMVVRRILHRLGFRYRLHARNLPGRPDVVFTRKKKAIFVNGCFWHRHDCHLGRLPKSRLDFWLPKLEKNRQRDGANRLALDKLGWRSLTVWECELNDAEALSLRLRDFLGS